MAPDHYEVLGVLPGARHGDIRAAYRELMRRHHPDVHPGDPSAEEMARRLTAAWAVLGRPSSRAAYDRVRSADRTQPLPLRDAGGSAYSAVGTDYRRAFHLASLKIAGVVLALGVVVLLAISR